MAVDSATLSTASGILKEDYQPGIQNQINISNALMAEMEKSSKDIIEGKYAVLALRLGLSQATGATAELGALPGAQRSLVVQSKAYLRFLYGVIRVSGPFLESSKSDKASFVRGITSESEGITDAMKLDLNRQFYGDGSGLCAICDTTSTSLVVVLDADTNMLYFEEGMLVDLMTMSNVTAVSNGTKREIASIDVANHTITLNTASVLSGDSGTVSTSSTTGVYRHGTATIAASLGSSSQIEITGLDQIVDDTSICQGVDPTTAGYRRWASYVKGSYGTFSIATFQNAVDQAHDQSGEWITHIFSNSGPRNKYLAALTATVQFMPQEATKTLNGGFKGLAYMGGGKDAVWVKDPYAPNKTIFGLHMPSLGWRRLKDFEFVEVNGSVWLPDIYGSSGTDSYKAVLATYAELVAKRRNCHFKLTGVTVA